VNIKFRVPTWIARCQSATIAINGTAFGATESEGYLNVSRVWTTGDQIELTLPAEVRVSRLPDNQNVVAFVYGPVVLSAGLGTQQMESTGHKASEKATIPFGVIIKDYITINSSTTINEWIADINRNLVQTAGTLEFTLRNTDEDNNLKFTPHYQRYTDRYGIYFRLEGTVGSAVDAGVCPDSGAGGSGGADGGIAGSDAGGIDGGSGGTSGSQANVGGSGGASAAPDGGGSGGGSSGTADASGIATVDASGSATAGASGGDGALGGNTTQTGGARSAGGCSCNIGRPSANPEVFGLLLVLGFFIWRRLGGAV
jgi:hypothetical protein